MDYIKQIHDYADGTLENEYEEQLFMQIAGNEELRTELKQNLFIKDAVRNDSAAFNPSPESTLKIFNKLGFTKPDFIAGFPNNIGSPAKLNFWQKFGQGITGGFIGALTMLLLFLLLFKNSGNNNTGNEQNNNNKAEISSNNQIPVVKSYENLNNNNNNNKINNNTQSQNNTSSGTRVIYKPVYIYVPEKNNSSENNDDNSDNKVMDNIQNGNSINNEQALNKFNNVRYSNLPNGNYLSGHSNSIQFLNSKFPEIQNKPDYVFAKNERIGLSLEISGQQYWFSQSPTINPSHYANFNNTSASLLYSFDNHFSAGIDVREENFYQVYTGIDSNYIYQYQQQPNFTSFGLLLRYKFGNLFWNINPFAQMYGGINQAGFINRIMAGFELEPYEYISFLFGLEYSNLSYHHNNLQFNSTKYGFNYGVSVKF